jgi:hypothetical protein
MFNRLNHHLQVTNSLVPRQFGFRKGPSTDNAVFTLTGDIFTAINQWKQKRGIFCHLIKALDNVDCKICLAKLYYAIASGSS